MTDSVTIDLRRYERQQDAAEGRMKRIRVMVADLLEGECDPYAWGNFEQAFESVCLGSVADALRCADYAAAGETLDKLLRKYWEDRAWKQAENEIDNDDGT